MSGACYHVDDMNWEKPDEKWGGLRCKEIISKERGGSTEFFVVQSELPAGAKIPLHKTKQAETGYVLSGHAKIRLGVRTVTVGPASAYYFPAGAPRSIEALGPGSLCYFCTYACERLGEPVELEPATEEEAAKFDIMNLPDQRWALSEDFETWVNGEPTKGAALRCRYLFDNRFGQQEMMVGVGELDPGVHYSLHYHIQPEIYYILGGRGIVYLAEEEFEVGSGSVLYIEREVVHGADALGQDPLRIYYIYGAETVGQAETWTPVEDIYTLVRRL